MSAFSRLLLSTSLAVCLGCAKTDWIDRTVVTVDVSGAWSGSVASLDGQPMIDYGVRLDLQQKAAKVIGSFQLLG